MADRREEIILAAAELVESGGREAASVRAVAKKVGIGASTLRHYFASQSDLMTAVAEHAYHRQVSDCRIMDASLDPVDRLSECLCQYLPPDEESLPVLIALWAGHLGVALGANASEKDAAVLSHLYRFGLDKTRAWLRVLADEGHIAHTDVDEAAQLLIALCDGLMPQLGIPRLGLTLEQASARVRWMCAAVLRSRPGD